MSIIRILEEFTSIRFKINRGKKSVAFSKLSQENENLINILGFQERQLPVMYLGIPITGKKKTQGQCWKLIQPIEKLLVKWSGKCMSYGGRI